MTPSSENVKSIWKTAFRKSLIIALSSVLMVALTFVNSCATEISGPSYQELIQIEEIEATFQQLKEDPPPPKEVFAEVIAAEENEVVDIELTIRSTDLQREPLPEIPKVPDVEIVDFVLLEVQPKVIHQVNPQYPDLARKGGVEGRVLVQILIGLDGTVEEAKVIKASPEGFFDSAAIEAALQWRFSPAFQRDKPVKVRYQLPFNFRLR